MGCFSSRVEAPTEELPGPPAVERDDAPTPADTAAPTQPADALPSATDLGVSETKLWRKPATVNITMSELTDLLKQKGLDWEEQRVDLLRKAIAPDDEPVERAVLEKMLEAMSGLIADARSETKGDKSSTDGAILVAENAELRRRVEELERRAKEAAAESSMPVSQGVRASVEKLGLVGITATRLAADGSALHSKFASSGDAFTYSFGGVEQFFAGLEGLVGTPSPEFLPAMATEHANDTRFVAWNAEKQRTTTPEAEWRYVAELRTGDSAFPDRDTGYPVGWRLADFGAQPEMIKAGLLLPEVAGLRLYTGPMFSLYNGVLRQRQRGKFVTTLHAINSAIIKLARLTPACTVYRGVSGGVLPKAFWEPNQDNVMGGVEFAFMSTTVDKSVALGYMANSGKTSKMLFQIQMGMIDRGADVSKLSQFPNEREILFAPLTGLEVVKAPRVEDGVIVVELRLSCNLKDETMDHVVAKMQRTHISVLESMRVPGAPQTGELDVVCGRAARRGAYFFNEQEGFIEATRDAFRARSDMFASLATEAAWADETGDDAAVAGRMRASAQVLARNDHHAEAAALLGMAAARGGVAAEHADAVSTWCVSWGHDPSASQRRALHALSMLLASGIVRHQPWPGTVVALAQAGGHQIVAERLCLTHKRPPRLVVATPFYKDATRKARRGSKLLAAAEVGDVEAVRAALALSNYSAESANESADNSVTPLMLAAAAASAECVQLLLESGAKPAARSTRHVTALLLSAIEGSVDIVRPLLAAKAEPDVAEEGGTTPLIAAASEGHAEVAAALLHAGASLDLVTEQGVSALMFAAQGGCVSIVSSLLQRGARADLVAKSPENPCGTALIGAARSGSLEVIAQLLAAGSAINGQRGDGTTPIIQAAWNNHATAIEALVDAKADVNHTDKTGMSALMRASNDGHMDAVRTLLKLGAKKGLVATDSATTYNATTNNATTALSLARSNKHELIVELLQAA